MDTGPESSVSEPPRDELWPRLEREKALLNELRSQDFFLSEGDGEGEDADGMAICALPAPPLAAWGGDDDEAELRLVNWEAKLETESVDSWRCAGDKLLVTWCSLLTVGILDSMPCFRNWSINCLKSCSSFSCNERNQVVSWRTRME